MNRKTTTRKRLTKAASPPATDPVQSINDRLHRALGCSGAKLFVIDGHSHLAVRYDVLDTLLASFESRLPPRETPEPSVPVGIGSVVWFFDENRRRYTAPVPGRIWGELTWREHWVERYIVGETSRSWLVGWGPKSKPTDRTVVKVSKTEPGAHWAMSAQEVNDRAFCQAHRIEISDGVGRLTAAADAPVLRKIQSLLEEAAARKTG